VAAEPHTSGPPVCHALASEVGLRQLPAVLTDLYSTRKRSAVDAGISHAISELDQLATSAPAALAVAMKGAASALGGLTGPDPSAQSVTAVGTALSALANHVHSVCHFSVS
jgi:hypothetical protein